MGKAQAQARAEEMYRKAMQLTKNLGSKKGMVIQYLNLGEVYEVRSNQSRAEEMYTKALVLFEELGTTQWKALSYIELWVKVGDGVGVNSGRTLHHNFSFKVHQPTFAGTPMAPRCLEPDSKATSARVA